MKPFHESVHFNSMMRLITKYRRLLLIFIVLSSGTITLSGQTKHAILDRINVFEVNGAVHIDCTIAAGNTCNGISYFRSDDGLDFIKVGEVTGICGSPDFPVRYQFVDENPPKNKLLRYTVNFGGFGDTEEYLIEVVDTDLLGYQVRPNPTDGRSLIFFKNPSNTTHTIQIYDLSGRAVFSGQTIDKFFEVDLVGYTSGLYIFNITEDRSGSRLQGKIMRQ